jgi:hypothetical protein
LAKDLNDQTLVSMIESKVTFESIIKTEDDIELPTAKFEK